MILYHGTSAKNLDLILKQGLLPRSSTGHPGYWEDELQSKPDFVYLTNAYAAYFGMKAALDDDTEVAILKVKVDESELYPDEDFIAYLHAEKSSRMIGQNKFNPHIDPLEYRHLSGESLMYHGTVCTLNVTPERVLGHRVLDTKNAELLIALGADSVPPVEFNKVIGKQCQKALETLFEGGIEAVLAMNCL